MRTKKWTDCPVCGSKKTMRVRKNLGERFIPNGYPPLDIDGLDGQFCESCGDGFWSVKSERRIARLLAEHRAEHDATRVVAAELASVKEAAEAMHITVQGVHKMMDTGRLRYVIAGGLRLPLRKSVAEGAVARNAAVV